ncbi:hypothetical protein HY971_00265 [Candidatus Kaiserbacteria bacterium]|nr:hypothetical protein [Candidatus Kaiserbacteria bacterium]
MDEKRRNEIAFLLDLHDLLSSKTERPSTEVNTGIKYAAITMMKATLELEEKAKEVASHLQRLLSDKAPSEAEVEEYIRTLANEGMADEGPFRA